eukprot:TRINITY_DN30880_c0_g1_i1.p2 TRINITY_DN30880_c0_g1~~TRINITY_DN30880_c0_g1_i1.p2  ORF type:complete len:129 (-),score=14.80 TRINITY_DN30880_c0_g1_i1:71-457(-)
MCIRDSIDVDSIGGGRKRRRSAVCKGAVALSIIVIIPPAGGVFTVRDDDGLGTGCIPLINKYIAQSRLSPHLIHILVIAQDRGSNGLAEVGYGIFPGIEEGLLDRYMLDYPPQHLLETPLHHQPLRLR